MYIYQILQDMKLTHTHSDALRPESSTYNKQLASTITECDADGVPVTHYHFTAWPDHGVPSPSDHPALIALIVEVGRRQVEEEKEVWVHWYVYVLITHCSTLG